MGMVPGRTGWTKWPNRVAVVGCPVRTGRLSQWTSVQMVHHDLLQLLPSGNLVLSWHFLICQLLPFSHSVSAGDQGTGRNLRALTTRANQALLAQRRTKCLSWFALVWYYYSWRLVNDWQWLKPRFDLKGISVWISSHVIGLGWCADSSSGVFPCRLRFCLAGLHFGNPSKHCQASCWHCGWFSLVCFEPCLGSGHWVIWVDHCAVFQLASLAGSTARKDGTEPQHVQRC